MADPRNNIRYKGKNVKRDNFWADGVTITFERTEARGTSKRDLAVKLSGNQTVALVGDGEIVLGQLQEVEPDGLCVVQVGGPVELPAGTGATLTPGNRVVGALLVAAKGYIKDATTGTAAAAAAGRGIVYDATTATAIVVDL